MRLRIADGQKSTLQHLGIGTVTQLHLIHAANNEIQTVIVTTHGRGCAVVACDACHWPVGHTHLVPFQKTALEIGTPCVGPGLHVEAHLFGTARGTVYQ